jgi:hypothetical protein
LSRGLKARKEESIARSVKTGYELEGPDAYHMLLIRNTTVYMNSHFSRSVMSDLKTQLYAKFGDAINLEADD